MPLPEDRGRRGDGRPKVHRFRSHWAELGRRLRAFREGYGLTQSEVARAAGAAAGSAVTQWETGAHVPDGLRRERVEALVDGRLWPELRADLVAEAGEAGLPVRWAAAARWYRRASRERAPRRTVGAAVAAVLDDVRTVDSPGALRQRYRQRDGGWAHDVAARHGLGTASGSELRRLGDAGYGLRWLELEHGLRFDLRRSLVSQLPLRRLAPRSAGGKPPDRPEG